MSYHYAFLGHGSLEESTLLKAFPVPNNIRLFIYAPPGAAIAGGYADDVYEAIVKNPKVRMAPEGYAALLREHAYLRFRQTKGASNELHDNYSVSGNEHGYPKYFDGGAYVPNYTLTGSSSLKYSGLYCVTSEGDSSCTHKLYSNTTLYLRDWVDYISEREKFAYVHWLACASDHTNDKLQSTSSWEDMKIDIE